ncbi:glycosyltransferase [Microbacterium sp. NPDC089987]|uniref:glycosyltransferase n=1 Tax=Microbacterium sp. NPDC089987 TaxID=3364202 RepID=UPI00380978E5
MAVRVERTYRVGTPSQRLCFVVTAESTAMTFLQGYLEYLKEDGWNVTLVCSPGRRVAEYSERENIPFVPVKMRRGPSPIFDVLSLLRLIRVLRRVRPDVLVYATPKASLLAASAGALLGIPVRAYELWGLRAETVSGLRGRVLAALEWTTARLSTTYIANSHSLARRARELGVAGGKKARVLGKGSSHGVDAEHFSREATSHQLLPSDDHVEGRASVPVVGFIGRLHPDKGIDTLFAALEEVALSGVPFQVVLVGRHDGVDAGPLLSRLQERVPVHFVGQVQDVRPALASMDVLVLPSRREGFPNVVLEAAAMEVPAIVSDATGCVDSVLDGKTGFVTPVGNVTRLAAALDRLLTDDTLRREMGRTARQQVLTDFVPRQVWAKHSIAWRNALESRE